MRRSALDPSLVQLVDNRGPSSEMTLAGVVDTIIRMFSEQDGDSPVETELTGPSF